MLGVKQDNSNVASMYILCLQLQKINTIIFICSVINSKYIMYSVSKCVCVLQELQGYRFFNILWTIYLCYPNAQVQDKMTNCLLWQCVVPASDGFPH